jgi:hypothetical protein
MPTVLRLRRGRTPEAIVRGILFTAGVTVFVRAVAEEGPGRSLVDPISNHFRPSACSGV